MLNLNYCIIQLYSIEDKVFTKYLKFFINLFFVEILAIEYFLEILIYGHD